MKRTIAIDEDELRRLLNERDRLREQVTELQARGTELVQENRALVKVVRIDADGLRKLFEQFLEQVAKGAGS